MYIVKCLCSDLVAIATGMLLYILKKKPFRGLDSTMQELLKLAMSLFLIYKYVFSC